MIVILALIHGIRYDRMLALINKIHGIRYGRYTGPYTR